MSEYISAPIYRTYIRVGVVVEEAQANKADMPIYLTRGYSVTVPKGKQCKKEVKYEKKPSDIALQGAKAEHMRPFAFFPKVVLVAKCKGFAGIFPKILALFCNKVWLIYCATMVSGYGAVPNYAGKSTVDEDYRAFIEEFPKGVCIIYEINIDK